jgi:hypothetical protein
MKPIARSIPCDAVGKTRVRKRRSEEIRTVPHLQAGKQSPEINAESGSSPIASGRYGDGKGVQDVKDVTLCVCFLPCTCSSLARQNLVQKRATRVCRDTKAARDRVQYGVCTCDKSNEMRYSGSASMRSRTR